jgi:hypothetical protein
MIVMFNPPISPGAPDLASPIFRFLHLVMTILIAFWCLTLLVIWIPHYLTWPWFCDHEHFAMIARSWEVGVKPYSDLATYQFPGEIYLFWVLGKLTGWGNTVSIYAFDVMLVFGLGILLILWGLRLSGRLLPGLIGFSSFLLFYLSVKFDVAAQRETHTTVLMLASLMMPTIWAGRGGRVISAVAFGLALLIRPQVVVLLPAILLSLDRSARPPGAHWLQSFLPLLTWGLISGLTLALGFLPLLLNGSLIDFWDNLQSMRSTYGRDSVGMGILDILANVKPLWLPKHLLLASALVVGLLPWHRPNDAMRRSFPVVLIAMVGVSFYHAISPLRIPYHATPQIAIAAMGLTFVAAQLVQGQTRPLARLAALAVLFLFFGAREKPRALEVLSPGDRTYGLRESLRVLRTGDLPRKPAVGFYESPGYRWEDTRAAILYLKEQVPAAEPVAPLLMLNRAAAASVAARSVALPIPDGNALLMVDDPVLTNRVVTALEYADPCVVLWNPSQASEMGQKFIPLWNVIRQRFEPEARFGNIEIWHLRPVPNREAATGRARGSRLETLAGRRSARSQ